MKKLLTAVCAALCLFAGTSCSDDDKNENYTEKVFSYTFAYVNDISSGAVAAYTNVAYKLTLYYGDNKASLAINGLRLPDGTNYPTMSLRNLRWKVVEGGWYEIEGTNLTPEVAVSGEKPVFTTFKLRYLPRYLDKGLTPSDGFVVRYTVDAKYSVTSAYAVQKLFGETVSTNVASGSEYKTLDTDYELNFNMDTRRLQINIKNARFMDRMPAGFNIVLKDIEFVINGTTASWNVASITPYIGGTPYENYKITNLKGSMDFGDEFELEFDCNPNKMGNFHVEADCDYTNVK